MKKIFLVALSGLIFSSARAQEKQDTLSLEDFEMPNSPGFTLLDKAPSVIERPNSTKAFIVSTLSNLAQSTAIPKNFAVEVTPFWYLKHNNMTALKYSGWNIKKQKQNIFGELKKASFSAALVTTSDTLSEFAQNNIAFGFRSTIISLRSSSQMEKIIELNKASAAYLRDLPPRRKPRNMSDSMWKVNEKAFLDSISRNKNVAAEKLRDALRQRPAFALNGAFAYSSFFANSSFKSNRFGRMGAWLTLNHSINLKKRNYLNYYILGRYIKDGTILENAEYVNKDHLDIGGKLEFEFKNIVVSYEYISRTTGSVQTTRSTGNIRYRISDKVFINGAFGKNYGEDNNIISILGINWGIGTGKEKVTVNEGE